MLLRTTLAVCLAAAPGLAAAQSFAPADWADGVKLNELVDRNPDPKIVEIDLTARLADVQIDGKTVHAWTYDGGHPRTAHPRARRRSADRPLHERAARSDHRPLARRARADRDGRRAGDLAARGDARRQSFDLRLRGARRRPLLVPPARRCRRRRSASASTARCWSRAIRDEHRSAIADELVAGAERHRARRRRACSSRPDSGGDSAGMVFGREGDHVLVNGRVRHAVARAPRRAAAVAHRQRREEPLLPARARRPAVHAHRRRRRPAGYAQSRASIDAVRPVSASTCSSVRAARRRTALTFARCPTIAATAASNTAPIEDLLTIEFAESDCCRDADAAAALP